MKTLSVAQMKTVEKNAVSLGVPYLELMENAGIGCARKIAQKYYVINKSVVILCGRGNNGGDGFVIARKLYEKGANVTIVLCQGQPQTKQASYMFPLLEQVNVDVLKIESDFSLVLFKIKQADFLVDAIFGTGFHGYIEGPIHQILERANASFAKRIAVDIPSGINGDTGKPGLICFHADCTLALASYKKAHQKTSVPEYLGELELIDIGIPPEAYDGMDLEVIDITPELIKNNLPTRKEESNKGDYGKLLNIAGCVGMGGAAIMCTQSALHSGAGLVTLACVKSVVQSAFHKIMEATTIPLEENHFGTMSSKNQTVLLNKLKTVDACVLGCGLGNDEEVQASIIELINSCEIPMVLDADGINAVASDINIVTQAKCKLVLTPHPGEMARLSGLSIEQIQNNRVKTAYDFAREHKVVLLLKGHHTIIATPDGTVYRNLTGNAGMAKGGSGDVLAGMIGSFLAQGLTPEQAAITGAYLHGLAGDLCAQKYTQYAMSATYLIEEIPTAFKICLN